MQPVVGLGGSAGSLSALQAFFSQMPEDSGLAFVVVLHLSPEHESSLATLLQNVTAMPVIQVSETVKVQAKLCLRDSARQAPVDGRRRTDSE
jgi:two-component system, chemotaxis family, CheB/CheR fusion protein